MGGSLLPSTGVWYLPLNENGTLWRWLTFQGHILKKRQIRLLLTFVFAIELYHCECCTLWPWLAFSMSKLQILAKLFLQICLLLYGTRRRVAIVLFNFCQCQLLVFPLLALFDFFFIICNFCYFFPYLAYLPVFV